MYNIKLSLNHSLVKKFLLINILILFVMSFFIIPTNDTYYYWTWAQHLQLSYFDGPPMIAYVIWLTTHLFGNNFFSLGLISFICTLLASYIVYKITQLFADKTSAMLASLIWLVYPFSTTRFIAISMTLDGLEVVFSLLIVYFTCKYLLTSQIKYIYALGVAVGFGLLAKYNVVILVLGIIVFFMVQTNYRKIFINPHLYLAALISVIIFLPVLTWNYQNDWLSFKYQLNSHSWSGASGAINSADKHGLLGMWFYIKACVFGVLHILLVMALVNRFKLKVELPKNICNKLLMFIISFILLFWLYKSYSAHVGLNYMVTVSALIIILVAQQLARLNLAKFVWSILVLFSIISLIMQVNRSIVHSKDQENYNKYVKSGLITRILFN